MILRNLPSPLEKGMSQFFDNEHLKESNNQADTCDENLGESKRDAENEQQQKSKSTR